jgi:FtsP/CotA-like multicopper oxidase with cupredoxin domain
MDTGMVNGTAYPYIEVDPTVVRFRMLSVGNDRFFNLSLFVAADKNSSTTSGTTGAVLCDGTNAVNPADCTEVKMVPFNSSYDSTCPANPEGPGCFPSWWYTIVTNGFTFDDRAGGVPDPTTRGPAMIQVGTEGGFLPAPVVIRNQPVNYVYNRRDITVGNINEKALLLGPAERADVLVDFSQFAGKTLILYNDAPAPVPAADPRLDYYTGDPDQTDTGGAPSTLPGYGPNTRTVMQIRVRNTTPTNPSCIDPDTGATVTATQDCVSPIYTNLQTALPAAFVASQEPIIVPQTAYNDVYGLTTVDSTSDPTHNVSGTVVGIQDTSMTLTPIGQPQLTLDLQPKSIIEDFTLDYGRMNAILGVEVPHTNNTNQTSLLEAYMDPPTEMVRLTALNNTPAIGEAADGTQLWKITHNGVDTHAIHFHMFHVQLVNRVGWDGAIRLPDANELGWKDTVRMNPLEDVIVAMRPKTLELPFDVVNSWRPLDPAQQLGAQWQALEPTGTLGAVTITNTMTNFGWEHVWHCHLLGHEENDMMRALVIVEPPMDPNGLTATRVGSTAVLNWSDTSVNETSFTVLRDQGTGFVVLASLGANVTTYTDTNPGIGAVTYRVIASNTVGADPIAAPGYSQMTADSGPSNDATIPAIPVAGVAPTLLSFGNVEVGATSASQAVTVSNTGAATLTVNIGITGEYAQTNDCGAGVAVGGTCTINVTFSPLDLGTRLGSLSISTNDPVNPSFTVDLTGNGTVLFAPTGLAGTAVRIPGTQTENVTLTWTDNSLGEVNFELQRAQVNNRRQCNTTTAFSTLTTAIPALTGTGTVTYLDPAAPRQGSLCYRVRALSSVPAADSTWSNRAYVTTP